MKLIHTRDLRLCEFVEKRIPPYAILSHTWGNHEDEISYTEFVKREQTRDFDPQSKIVKACQLAWSESWEFLWVDTCCIDKTSSADLTESINSMFRWYSDATICYIYLADVRIHARPDEGSYKRFRESRWFSRGWTLQELLAPSKAIFLDKDWEIIGTKESLCKHLTKITGIADYHLFHHESASVAQKMSWASHRTTTRTEDLAYCLLGIFNVNMTLIYGEGENAFRRLQEEIIRNSTDQSIFAWAAESGQTWKGMLAKNPLAFRFASRIIPLSSISPSSYTISNAGLNIRLVLLKPKNTALFHAPLACVDATEPDRPVWIQLHAAAERHIRIQSSEVLYRGVMADSDLFDSSAAGTGEMAVQIPIAEPVSHPQLLQKLPRVTRILLSNAAIAEFIAVRCIFDGSTHVVAPEPDGGLSLATVIASRPSHRRGRKATQAPAQSDEMSDYEFILFDKTGLKLSIIHESSMRDDCVDVENSLSVRTVTLCWSPLRRSFGGQLAMNRSLHDDIGGNEGLDGACYTRVGDEKLWHVYLREVVETSGLRYLCVHIDVKNLDTEAGLAEVLQ